MKQSAPPKANMNDLFGNFMKSAPPKKIPGNATDTFTKKGGWKTSSYSNLETILKPVRFFYLNKGFGFHVTKLKVKPSEIRFFLFGVQDTLKIQAIWNPNFLGLWKVWVSGLFGFQVCSDFRDGMFSSCLRLNWIFIEQNNSKIELQD